VLQRGGHGGLGLDKEEERTAMVGLDEEDERTKKKKKEEEERSEAAWKNMRGERLHFFMIIIILGNATVQPNALGCTIAFLRFRKNIRYLLYLIFCDFLDIFPKFKE